MTKSEIQRIRTLQQKKFRNETGLFVVEGKKMVEELLASNWKCEGIYSCDDELLKSKSRIAVQRISRKEMDMISGLSTHSEILAVVYQNPHQVSHLISHTSNLLIALDGISDPGNMGTIIRTCDWFGVNQIICSENCVELYNPKVVAATMGSIFHLNVDYVSLAETIPSLKQNGFQIMGATLNGKSLHEFQQQKKTVLVIGSESHGISNEVMELLDSQITIEGNGKAESLNAAVAAGILLSHFQENR